MKRLIPSKWAGAMLLCGVSFSSQAADLPNGQYTIVFEHSGRCLDVAWASRDNGANIAQVQCNGNTAQAFNVQDMGNGAYRLLNVNSGKAVDVASASTANGANVQQWADNGSNAQRFQIVRQSGNLFTLTNVGSGKCVSVAGAGTGDGANVEQQSCVAAAHQRVRFYPVGMNGVTLPIGQYTITSVNSGKCLDVAGASLERGANVQQWSCNNTGAQRFDLRTDIGYYRITNSNSGKYLDIANASTSDGANLQQWDLTGSDAQRFTLVDTGNGRYQIRARHSGACLDVTNRGTQDGANVQQWGCGNAQSNQLWTITPTGSSTVTPPPPPGSWELVWSDEFNGTTLDRNKWNIEVNGAGGGNNEQQYYTDRSSNIFLQDGKLVLQGLRERYCAADGCRDFTSGRINSKGKGGWLYGRFEARAKLPRGQGAWPAIWMLPTDNVYGQWPLSGEIDIMEAINVGASGGNTVYGTLHYGKPWPNNVHQGKSYVPSGSISEGFHTYAMEWEPGEIRVYADGVLYGRFNDWFTTGGAYPAPFNQRFHWVLNVALGGNWPGPVSSSMPFPARMEVDWVRVYRKR